MAQGTAILVVEHILKDLGLAMDPTSTRTQAYQLRAMISHLRRLMREWTSKKNPAQKAFPRPRILEVALKLKRLPEKAKDAEAAGPH